MNYKLSNSEDKETKLLLEQILRALKKISYGSIEILVHDSKVVQIECREKIRLDKQRGN